MKKRKTKVLFLITVMGMSTIGCSQTTVHKDEGPFDATKTVWESQKLQNNLVADFQAENTLEKCNVYEAERSTIPAKKIMKVFFSEDCSPVKKRKEELDDDGQKKIFVEILTSEDGTRVASWGDDGVMGETKEYAWYTNFADQYQVRDTMQNLIKWGTDDELKLLKKKEVEEKIRGQIKQLNLPFAIREMKFFTLSAKFLNESQEKYLKKVKNKNDMKADMNMKKKWKEQEGAYWVEVYCSLDDIELNGTKPDPLNATISERYKIQLLYNRHGCVYLECPIFEITGKKEKAVVPVAHALANLRKDLAEDDANDRLSVISESEINYVILQQKNAQDTQVTMTPVWIFRIDTKTTDDEGKPLEYSVYRYVNAITAEVMRN